MRKLRVAACTVAILTSFEIAPSVAEDYVLMGTDSAVINHYPGADSFVGTADDVVSADVTATIGSDPNFLGQFSYAAASGVGTDPALPAPRVGVAFLGGTMSIDSTVAQMGGGALVTGLDAFMTAHRQGLGSGTMKITAVNGGTFDEMTNAVTVDVDVELAHGMLSQQISNVMLSGSAYVVAAADYGSFAANAYVQNELIPRAQDAGASSLAFLQVSGTIPPTAPFLIASQPLLMTLAGLSGVPAGNQADLQLQKTVDATGFVNPGDTVVFTLQVVNNGTAAAADVVVNDRIRDQMTWISDDCGAGPPTSGVLAWNIGTLANQATVVCNVTVMLEAEANFNQRNGATVGSSTVDPDPSNNTGRVVVLDIDDMEGLQQTPNGATGFQADRSCGACAQGTQAMAENFKVDRSTQLIEVVFHGAYSTNMPFADDFLVQIFEDANNEDAPGTPSVPGALLATLNSPVARQATGGLIAAFFQEYEYRVRAALPLARGIYWVVISNDSAVGSGDWFWETGNADASQRSLPEIAANPRLPPSPFWTVTTNFQLALEVRTAGRAAAPAIGPMGLSMVVAVLVGAGLVVLRRRRRV